MAQQQVKIRNNPFNGQKEYLNDELLWEPLAHNETKIVHPKTNEEYLWNDEKNTFLPKESYADIFKRSINAATADVARTLADLGISDEAEASKLMTEGLMKEREVMPSPEMYTALRDAEEAGKDSGALGKGWEYFKAIVKNPLDVAAPMLAESAAPSAVAIAPQIGAALLTGGSSVPVQAASILGAGALGSMTTNYGSAKNQYLVDEAVKRGINPNDANALSLLANDPQVKADTTEKALLRSAPIAVTDALAGYLPFRAATAANRVAQARLALGLPEATTSFGTRLGNAGKAIGTQVGLAGTGDVGGQYAAEGAVTDPLSVAAEMGLEVFGGAGEIATMGWIANKQNPRTPIERQIEDNVVTPILEEVKANPTKREQILSQINKDEVLAFAEQAGVPVTDINEDFILKTGVKLKAAKEAEQARAEFERKKVRETQEETEAKQVRFIDYYNNLLKPEKPFTTVEEVKEEITKNPTYVKAAQEERLMQTGFRDSSPALEEQRLDNRLSELESIQEENLKELNKLRQKYTTGTKTRKTKDGKVKELKLADSERRALEIKISALETAMQAHRDEVVDVNKAKNHLANSVKRQEFENNLWRFDAASIFKLADEKGIPLNEMNDDIYSKLGEEVDNQKREKIKQDFKNQVASNYDFNLVAALADKKGIPLKDIDIDTYNALGSEATKLKQAEDAAYTSKQSEIYDRALRGQNNRLLPAPEKLLALPDYTSTGTPSRQPPTSIPLEEIQRRREKADWIKRNKTNARKEYTKLLKDFSKKRVEAKYGNFESYLEGKFNERSPAIYETKDSVPNQVTSTGEVIPSRMSPFEKEALLTKANEDVELRGLVERVVDNLLGTPWFNTLSSKSKKEIISDLFKTPKESLLEMATRDLSATAPSSKKRQQRSKPVTERLQRKYQKAPLQDTPLSEVSEVDLSKLSEQVRRVLNRIGITKDVTVRLVADKFVGEGGLGYTLGKEIVLASAHSVESILNTLNHEVIHALRNLGLFSPKEWKSLVAAAEKNNWIQKYDIERYYGDESREVKLEEAIAEHYKRNYKEPEKSPVKTLINRFKEFVDVVRSLFTGVYDPDVIFNKLNEGRLARNNKRALSRLSDKQMPKYAKAGLPSKELQTLKGMRDSLEENSISAYYKWFGDLLANARRYPILRPLIKTFRQRENIESSHRQKYTEVASRYLASYKKLTQDEINTVTKASIFLRHNRQQLPSSEEFNKTKSLRIELKEHIHGYAKAGETVVLNAKTYQELNEILKPLFQETLSSYSAATMSALINDLLPDLSSISKGTNIDMEIFRGSMSPNDLLKGFIPTLRGIPTVNQEIVDALENIALTIKKAQDEYSGSFYTPIYRPSSTYMRIYDRSKPLDPNKKVVSYKEPYEVVAVIPVPKKALTNGVASPEFMERWMNNHLTKIKETVPDAFISEDPKKMLQEIVSSNVGEFLGDDSFTIFEKLEMLLDAGVDSKERAKILGQLSSAVRQKGFANHFKKASLVAGYIHEKNQEQYLAGALAYYGNSFGTKVARMATAPQTAKALADIQEAVRGRVVHQSMLDWANEAVDYINNPPNDYSHIRAASTHYFMGLNPSTAFLQAFQGLHATAPILIQMFGGSKDAMTSIVKAYKIASKAINWTNLTEGEFIDTMKIEGLDPTIAAVLYELKRTRDLQALVTEELAALGARENIGLLPEQYSKFSNEFSLFTRKAANVSMSLVSRFEALNRIATAIATVELIQKAKKDPKSFNNLQKFLANSEFEDIAPATVDDILPDEIARAVIKITQGDNSRYNKAKVFRGKMAIPMQFMSFPMQMLNLYLGVFRSALGDVSLNDKSSWKLKNLDPVAAKAFGFMLMGLWATSGLFGAIPFGDPLRDAYDKIYKFITGVDPDLETQLRSFVAESTNPYIAEIVFGGLNPSISNRTGVSIWQGVGSSGSMLDLLGPTGGIVSTVGQAHDTFLQGHESLALGMLMPGIIRNATKAIYESQYGIVSQKGNIVPSDYSAGDFAAQVVGFTPNEMVRTRTAMMATQRAAQATVDAKERISDRLVSYRIKAIHAARNGDTKTALEYNKAFRDEFREAKANKDMEIRMSTIQKRVLEQLNAQKGKVSTKKIEKGKRQEVSELISKTYPQGYLKE